MRARVYFNLHKNKLSVQTKVAGKGWRVKQHVDMIRMENVRFHVSESGRQRVLAEKKKNVHAFVEGDVVNRIGSAGDLVNVSYNPYKSAKFILDSGEPIEQASAALIIHKKIQAIQ